MTSFMQTLKTSGYFYGEGKTFCSGKVEHGLQLYLGKVICILKALKQKIKETRKEERKEY